MIVNRAMVLTMLGIAAKNLKRVIMLVSFLGLIALNVLSLTSSAVHGFLYRGLAALPLTTYLQNSPTSQQKKLAKQNKALKQKISSRNAASKKIARRITARTARATSTNVASVFTESIPIYGIAFIVATTAYEVHAACENLKDIDAMLIELGVEDDHDNTDAVCGQDIPTKDDILKNIQASEEHYSNLRHSWGEQLQQSTEETINNWREIEAKIMDYLGIKKE